MVKIPFKEEELIPVQVVPNRMNPNAPGIAMYDTPVSGKENILANYRKEPVYMYMSGDTGMFAPKVIPDNVARGFVFEKEMMDPALYGGKDMFGIEWEYVPVAGGSMVRPGKPFMEDANEWYDKLVFPDIDSWDWEGSAKANKDFLNPNKCNFAWLLNGAWFERLISFMEFENAAVALIDEDQQDAINDLFEKTTDLMCRIVDKMLEYYDNIDGFTVHDDWGSQANPFFSQDTAMEMIVPHMKKLVDHIHSKGKIADLHSCGHIESRIEAIIAAGWDSWTPMPMNDTHKLYEEYGDKILLNVCPATQLSLDSSEEEQRAAAREYVDKYCNYDKPSQCTMYVAEIQYPYFREEVYKQTRIKFSK